VNRNKRSITVNFKQPEGLQILRKLIARADVLVENFIPGKLDSMGLGYEDCSAINNRLIYASITGTFTFRVFTPSVHVGGPQDTDKQALIELRRVTMS
jgi:crotonobetainyl-CoA:carnitine CoA-transferase CaiB-like acyl-CoA transferase